MLIRLGIGLYRMRWSIVLLAPFLLLGLALYSLGIFPLLKSGGFDNPASESTHAQNLIDAKISTSTYDIVVLLSNQKMEVTDKGFMIPATTMLSRLRARVEVAAVSSYYETQNSQFLSKDKHEMMALVRLATSKQVTKDEAYDAIVPLLSAPPLQVTLGGPLAIEKQINQQSSADIERAELYTFPIVLVLLIVVFGGLIAALLPLFIGVIAIFGAFALLHVLANIMDVSIFAANAITGTGLGLAIDYSLFIITRFREELPYYETMPDPASTAKVVRMALERTMATAGRTVFFSALTVTTSLTCLLIFPQYFLRSIGLGVIFSVVIAMLATLVILPALLALLGYRVNMLSLQYLFRKRAKRAQADNEGFWYRLSRIVMRFPIPIGLAVIVLLLFLGSPFLGVSFGSVDARVLPESMSARIVADRLDTDFAQQGRAQAVIVIQTEGTAFLPQNLAKLSTYVKQIKALPGVLNVESIVSLTPHISLAGYQQLYTHTPADPGMVSIIGRAKQITNGNLTRVNISIKSPENASVTVDLVKRLRDLSVPNSFVRNVGGETAGLIDQLASLATMLPWALLIIAVSIFVLLFLMTGSFILPIKAIILNILSLTATFGALVWIFQEGHLQNILGFESTGTLESTQPILIFAIAFGLSMDYEVFLLSRIKEQFDKTGDNAVSVASGLQHTGRLITSAALLLAVVLAAFATSEIVLIKMIGIGLSIAIIVDAAFVRTLLVPASMSLIGKLNWWAPKSLYLIWKRIGLSEN